MAYVLCVCRRYVVGIHIYYISTVVCRACRPVVYSGVGRADRPVFWWRTRQWGRPRTTKVGVTDRVRRCFVAAAAAAAEHHQHQPIWSPSRSLTPSRARSSTAAEKNTRRRRSSPSPYHTHTRTYSERNTFYFDTNKQIHVIPGGSHHCYYNPNTISITSQFLARHVRRHRVGTVVVHPPRGIYGPWPLVVVQLTARNRGSAPTRRRHKHPTPPASQHQPPVSHRHNIVKRVRRDDRQRDWLPDV